MSKVVTRTSFNTRLNGADGELPTEITVVRVERDYRIASNRAETLIDSRRADVLTLTRRQASNLITALAEALDYNPAVDE